ncbi:MAG: glycosyl hydrolase-related protein, partial [Lachnospiraceae bacterium]|nr:glycosyl hydrolase-related protein [Lachnospiraceae bacterium]
EYALREAEYLAGLLRLQGGGQRGVPGREAAVLSGREEASVEQFPGENRNERFLDQLEKLWKVLLQQEFHDVLPGTSIERVNREAEEALAQVERESRALGEELLFRLAGGKALFNSLSWERSFRGMKLPSCGYLKLQDEETAPGQGQEELSLSGLQEREDVLPEKCCGDCRKPWVREIPRTFEEEIVFQNSFYEARIDKEGRVISLRDRRSGYEYAREPLNRWRLYRDVNVDYDAWELGRMYEQAPEKLDGVCSFRAGYLADGSMIVVVERQEKYFTARQNIFFRADSPRIDFETEIDWQERHRILKADFPTTVYTKEVLEEIQFGYIRRPTHKSRQYEQDLYETCHHKYAVLTDGENGFALLNDCKYGISAEDSRLSLTLLRAPVAPDMRADRGRQRFTYSILPFSGSFAQSRVTEEAYECNVEVTACGFDGAAQAERFSGENFSAGDEAEAVSFFRLEGGHAVLETCKPAFDRKDGVVLRLYESKGCAGVTTLFVPDSVKRIFACNMLEEEKQELRLEEGKLRLAFRAFEIKTIMLVISK